MIPNAPLPLRIGLMAALIGASSCIALAVSSVPRSDSKPEKIDRHAVVARHDIAWNDLDGMIPLGNGEFCFNADATGLQTFAGSTMSHWAWHSFPLPEGWPPERIPSTGTFQQGRNKGADVFPPETEEIRVWMCENPHAFNLGRLRLARVGGTPIRPEEISRVSRTLDLWSGIQTSSFLLDGQSVNVRTAVHPSLDAVVAEIKSPLLRDGSLTVELDFPYPSLQDGTWIGDFGRSEGHFTERTDTARNRVDFLRKVDGTTYHVALKWSEGGCLEATDSGPTSIRVLRAEYVSAGKTLDVTAQVASLVSGDRLCVTPGPASLGISPTEPLGILKMTIGKDGREQRVEVPEYTTFEITGKGSPHRFVLSAPGKDRLVFLCAFSPGTIPRSLPTLIRTFSQTAAHWSDFWTSGGAIDLSGSKDPRWSELERRIILSQYLVAAQGSGSFPSSESGLLALDRWHGRFHMEMTWWHLAHFFSWGRGAMAEKALDCYRKFLPEARKLADQLGYKGLKWPKSVGPNGRSAPWPGNQVLLWKQPHPLFFAELEYRRNPSRETLEKWREIVFGTAEHMADYAVKNPSDGLWHLDPAMPPSERGITRDTAFDLAYWSWGLGMAQRWRERLGLPADSRWEEIRTHLAPLPVADGVYTRSPEWDNTYTTLAWEHPDPVGVLGMLPPTPGVDPETARRTVAKVWETWDWNRTWGWDLPWIAMAAARTGQPEIAVEALLRESARNGFDVRGANHDGRDPYLPGNGGLLYAVAMMAAGWDGAPDGNAPGFPHNGQWKVKWEGLRRAP